MDTEGYLKSHGWRGLGYTLDSNDRGLKKPLLVSKKIDVLGVGKQKHQAQSDQWWLRAFDESLKQIGTGQKSALDSVRQNGINKGGLYGFFVRGEALQGTISDSPTPPPSVPFASTDSDRTMAPNDQFATEAAGKAVTISSSQAKKLKYANKRKRGHVSATEEDAGAEKALKRQKREQKREQKKEQREKKREEKKERKQNSVQKQAEAGASISDLQALSVPQATAEAEPKWEELSESRRTQYTARAAEKNLPPEEYYARRLAKKAKQAARNAPSAVPSAEDASFFVDITGDAKLADGANTAASSTSEPLQWHPDMLGDRKVKELSKAERKARLEWMRQRRAARHAAAGRNGLSKQDRQKTHIMKKMKARDRLVHEALKDVAAQGGGKVTGEQKREARKAAKRQMRELKKAKKKRSSVKRPG